MASAEEPMNRHATTIFAAVHSHQSWRRRDTCEVQWRESYEKGGASKKSDFSFLAFAARATNAPWLFLFPVPLWLSSIMSTEITFEIRSPIGADLVDFEQRNTKAFKCPLCAGAILPPREAVLTETDVRTPQSILRSC